MSIDVSTTYLGIPIRSPVLVGSCPLTRNPETVRELAAAGAGAVVLPSLFEEQVVHHLISCGVRTTRQEILLDSLSDHGTEVDYNGGPRAYLESIEYLKSLNYLPIIASLNGCTQGRWLKIATEIQEAGADALEITFESPVVDPSKGADEVEQLLIDCVGELTDSIHIPVSVKLAPFHTNLPNLAWRLIESGAAGLVCFAHDANWKVSIDSIETSVQWSINASSNMNQTISGLVRARAGGPSISVAASGGICTADDIVKATIAGADVVMLTSEIYREGPAVITSLLSGITTYLLQNGIPSFDDLIRSRPTLKPYLRSEYLKCLTHQCYELETARAVPAKIGDRWGHVL